MSDENGSSLFRGARACNAFLASDRVASRLLRAHAMRNTILLASTFSLASCGIGLEQDFDLASGPPMSDASNELLFELTNRGGNAPEPLAVYRIELADQPLSGGLFARSDDGDAVLELAVDAGTPGLVDSGDVIRAREAEGGMNLRGADNGRMLWINVMVLLSDQRSSDALTRSWKTVWSEEWNVGG